MKLPWLASAPILASSLVLLYGASFTLTLTVVQAFCTAGFASVKGGLAALRQSGSITNPAAYQPVVSGCYAGGFAALTVLRNEAAAAVAVGVDMGKRIGSLLEGFLLGSEEGVAGVEPEEMVPIGEAPSTPKSPAAAAARPDGWRRRWAAALLLGASVSAFVLLAILFVRPVRIASLCVLAAQSLVTHAVPLLSEATRARVDGTAWGQGLLIAAMAGFGMTVQAALYLTDVRAPVSNPIQGTPYYDDNPPSTHRHMSRPDISCVEARARRPTRGTCQTAARSPPRSGYSYISRYGWRTPWRSCGSRASATWAVYRGTSEWTPASCRLRMALGPVAPNIALAGAGRAGTPPR